MDVLSDVVGELIVLGVDAFVLGFCISQFSKCKHIATALESAPVLNIDGNLSAEVHKYPNEIIPYAVVRGLVKPLGNPITSNFNPAVTGVLQKLTIKEHVVARTPAGFWCDQTRLVHGIYNSCPFVLTNGNSSVEIIDALAADLLELDVITDKFEPMSLGVMDHVWGFFSGVRQRGLQTIEEMLRDGSYITVVGELSKNDKGQLNVHPPKTLPMYLITGTKTSLLKRINSSKDILRILLAVFGSVAVAMSCRVFYKYLKKKRRKAEEVKLKQALAAGRRERRARARDNNLNDAQLCVVCVENPKEIILLPCGHVCLCEDCSDNITESCPVCRVPIQSKSPAFIV